MQGCSKVMWAAVGAAVVITLITIPAVYYSSKFSIWPLKSVFFPSLLCVRESVIEFTVEKKKRKKKSVVATQAFFQTFSYCDATV